MRKKIEVLQRIAIFSGVSPDLLADIASHLEQVSVPHGRVLITQGDAPDALWILQQGRLKVHVGDVVIREVTGESIIGEFALLLGESRTASITALEDSALYRLDACVFNERLLGNLAITRGILKSLATRVIREDERNQRLMQNILPYEIAEELKNSGEVQVKSYPKVSVLFTDFKGFTALTETLSPQLLLKELNDCFTNFDEIVSRHRMEKIKTIGDAYMCAGGIPVANETNAVDAVLAALEIQRYIHQRVTDRAGNGLPHWACRLGINTGEVIAGIIGKHKFSYDIWSDTVNTASRMESAGEPGKVNISQSTYLEVKDFFDCEYRGKIAAKGKGEIAMYFVTGIKPALSVDGVGQIPNALFEQLLQQQYE
jgi:class 3 adenylate cyclase